MTCYLEDSTFDIRCSNLQGNELGDWVDCISPFADGEGNFSADPEFCDAESETTSFRRSRPAPP